MNTVSKRHAFLNSQKNTSHRITIGFAGIADFRAFIGQEYITGIMKAARDYDINFINMGGAIKYSFFDDIDFINHYKKTFKFMKRPLVDGLVTWASSLCEFLSSQEVINLFSEINPLPMVDIGYLDIPNSTSLRIDNRYSISLIMSHLIKVHGYRKFAFVGSKISAPHISRLRAFRQELADNGIEEIPNSVFMSPTMEPADLSAVTDEILKHHKLIDKSQIEAIVTSSDIIASQLIDELESRGISVPRDVAISGFNNQYKGITSISPVTTTDLAYFRRGYEAVEVLIDKIMNPHIKIENQLFKTTLVVRQSCGCFEKIIQNSGKKITDSTDNLFDSIKNLYSDFSNLEITDLIDSIYHDGNQDTPTEKSELLLWFQNFLKTARQKKTFDNEFFQDFITNLHQIVIPLISQDSEKIIRIERIFHQMRTLISVYIEYENLARKESPYLMTNLSQVAISFASASTSSQIKDVLRHQLGELDISGIILALSENMTHDISATNVEMILPEPIFTIKQKLPFRLTEPSLIPRNFFPQNRRFSMMLEILHHVDNYFGFAFLEIQNPNITVYDTVRMLLSNALYSAYLQENRINQNRPHFEKSTFSSFFKEDNKGFFSNKGVTSHQIQNYLTAHLNEMTNLTAMCESMGVSKSYLVRRCKELTGYTIQTLHEKMKIEQAKQMLRAEDFKLNEIASQLGFKNQNYFSNVFKKNTGMSPSEWVKRKG